MTLSRREFLSATSATAAGAALGTLTNKIGVNDKGTGSPSLGAKPNLIARNRTVITPDGVTLPHKIVDGWKIFHLIAEPVQHEFAHGLTGKCWGYNGRVHGPTIEAVEGDKVRIYVTNKLADPTTVHWHGLDVPNGMDGVGGLTQRIIESGETFKYEFVLKQHGTFMYHPHHDEMVQMAMGLMGMFVVHPKDARVREPDWDYVYLLSEWKMTPGVFRPDPNEMTDFNVLTLNGRAYPGTTAMVAKVGDLVRLRIGNLSASDHHPIHIHGHSFRVVETDGGPIPEAGQWPETTVLVPTGSTRTIEFVASNPGDWMVHCHMTHHMMNQMGHGIPNLIGLDPSIVDEQLGRVIPEYLSTGQTMADDSDPDAAIPHNSIPMFGGPGPFGTLNMGGMVTVIKIRESIDAAEDLAWYSHPRGTVAGLASPEELAADGVTP